MNTHHYFRTIMAGLFGTIALSMIMASILVVWANRTMTDTATYTQTITPLVTQPAVQEFVAEKVTAMLVQEVPIQEVAAGLLPTSEVTGKTPDQLMAAVRAEVLAAVNQVLGSPRVVKLWQETNESQHAELIRQLDADTPEVVLNFDPLVAGVIDELKQTKLAPLADKVALKPGTAKVDLKGSLVERIRQYYHGLQTAALVIVLVTLGCAGLAVWSSVHHMKTLRRVLVGTAVSAYALAALVAAPRLIPVGDPSTQKLVAALATTLLHNLWWACLVIGSLSVIAAVGSKLYERSRKSRG